MSLANLTLPAFLAGLAALAGALYLLQRLRVRHREVEVVTTLFWQQAAEEARARVLVQRFRHPWAYLLVLAISSLLWLGVADPRFAGAAGREHVLLLDGSAGMARLDGETGLDGGTGLEGGMRRWEAALAALTAEVARLPRDRTRVVWCGDHPRTLLLAGEQRPLLERRLAALAPVPCPASVEAELLHLASLEPGEPGATRSVIVFGDAPVRDEILALLPPDIEVRRADTGFTGEAAGSGDTGGANRGITALGVSVAASGIWDRVDVLVEVRGGSRDPGRAATDLAVTLDGEPLHIPPERSPLSTRESGERFVLRDVPAAGQRLDVRLVGTDVLALDDLAAILLPDRSLIRVALSPAIAGRLAPALEADPAVVLVRDAPDVVVRRAGEALGGAIPALELVPQESQEEAFLLRHAANEDSAAVLAEALGSLGLDRIDATGLATAAARPIAVGAMPGSGRSIGVWDVLLGDEYDFTRSRAFPLFVARAVRWLAETPELTPYAAAGEALSAPSPTRVARRVDWTGAVLDPLGAPFTPPRSGEYTGPRDTLVVSLLDLRSTSGAADGLVAAPVQGARAPWRLVTWILLLALALSCGEWFLHRTGRMP